MDAAATCFSLRSTRLRCRQSTVYPCLQMLFPMQGGPPPLTYAAAAQSKIMRPSSDGICVRCSSLLALASSCRACSCASAPSGRQHWLGQSEVGSRMLHRCYTSMTVYPYVDTAASRWGKSCFGGTAIACLLHACCCFVDKRTRPFDAEGSQDIEQ